MSNLYTKILGVAFVYSFFTKICNAAGGNVWMYIRKFVSVKMFIIHFTVNTKNMLIFLSGYPVMAYHICRVHLHFHLSPASCSVTLNALTFSLTTFINIRKVTLLILKFNKNTFI